MHGLETTNSFDRQLEKILVKNPRIKTKLFKVLQLLKRDIHDPSLKLHKLIGKNNWSVSVTKDIRIILRWHGSVLFCVQIGTHDEVY